MVREQSESDFKFGSAFGSLTGGLSGGGSGFSFGGAAGGASASSSVGGAKLERPKNDPADFHLGARIKHAQFGE